MKKAFSIALSAAILSTSLVAAIAEAKSGSAQWSRVKNTAVAQTREHVLLSRQVGVPASASTSMSGVPGTGSNKADLVVAPYAAGNTGLPGAGFCGPWNGGNQKLRLVVQNNGGAASETTIVTIRYKNPENGQWEGDTALNFPKIEAGQSKYVAYPIPAWAWEPGHHSSVQFAGAVDVKHWTDEMNEGNNAYAGKCLGPAG